MGVGERESFLLLLGQPLISKRECIQALPTCSVLPLTRLYCLACPCTPL